MQYVLFLVLGLGIGAVYAVLATGIVLTYKGTGVINFAAAAMVTAPLYVFSDLEQGKLTLPLPWVPSMDWVTPTWVQVGVAMGVAALLGTAVHFSVSRPLRSAPVLAKVVAAVGVMLVLQDAVGLKYGTESRARATLLPTGSLGVGSGNVPVDRLWLTAVVVVAAGGLALWFRHSRTGLAIQAAAENERAASFARLSPDALGLVTWVLASVFTTFVLILAGPAVGTLGPTNLTLLVVPALAAALIARLSSLWHALLAGLLLGVLQSELQFLSTTKSWWPTWAKQGLTDALPFVVVVVALFLLGRAIPARGDDTRVGLPPVLLPRNRPMVVLSFAAVAIVVTTATTGSYRFGIITSLASALIALSLVVLTGMVGQISLAQAALAGIAGLTLAKIGTAIPFPLSLIVAALVATIVGVLVGLPALRIRGAQLAIVTLAAAVTLERFVFNNPSIVSPSVDLIPGATLFDIDLSVRQGSDIARLPFAIFVVVLVTVVVVLVGNVIRAGSGRKMLAVRSNERAAASIGIAPARIKLLAFALSSFLAGLGGALIGYSRGQLSPTSFGVFVGLAFLAVAYLGGITSISGALVAGALSSLGIVFVLIDRNLDVGRLYGLLNGLGLIASVVMNPIGIAGKARLDAETRRRRKRARQEAPGTTRGDTPLGGPTEAAARQRAIGDVILRAEGVVVRYGGVRAVDEMAIEVRAGEIVGLIGPNGAGKTSFIDALTGFAPAEGTVVLDGKDLSRAPAHVRARSGLVRTWQSGELFDELSVRDNVRVVADTGHEALCLLADSVRPNPPVPERVTDALALMDLGDVADRRPSELSLGRQKALSVARSLALRPRVLLLDEPAAGLDTAESLEFGARLRRIAETGVGCLLVDHDMHLVLGVCDRIYVVEFGRPLASGRPREIRSNPLVVAAYLGATDVDVNGSPSGTGGVRCAR